jgi:hypothetical protein
VRETEEKPNSPTGPPVVKPRLSPKSRGFESPSTLGAPFPSGAYFIVSNQQDHDLQIALKKVGAFQRVAIAVPDAAELKSEYFLEKCPAKGCD